jgi:membrane protein DedA with SNARE-associated domain
MANAGLNGWLQSIGYLAVALFVGIESLGVPLPGETMLITAAVFAATTHQLSIVGIIAAAIVGAVIGDNIGFGIGWFGGYPILRRFGKYIRLDEAKLKVGRYIFMRHGSKVVFFGRFVSVLRTYAAFLAGTNRMHWSRFLVANAAGGIVWATLYGVGAYSASSVIAKLNTPVEIGFAALAVVVIVASAIFIRRNIKRLEAVAEAALPGPLEGFSAQ